MKSKAAKARRAEQVLGLRKLADFLEAHPEVQAPMIENIHCPVFDKKSIVDVARAASKATKGLGERWYELTVEFSSQVGVQWYTERENVCTRRVVKTTHVPEKVMPETVTPPVTIAAHDVEQVEWDCGELLRPVPKKAAPQYCRADCAASR